MVYGVGVDTIAIERIQDSLKSERFERFAFSKRERAVFKRNSKKLAGCFAAKEALSKALGTGVRGFSLDEISVLRDELGRPYFALEGAVKQILEEKRLTAHLSITNTEAEAT
ncbi:MAG: holo-ACP synthase, partial [Oscillospiraceae bacterium]|nr:holo-ACP synthase [Oscillospiraceae bacterium]